MLVARQNAFGQRSDGGQFQRLLRTLQGALEVTVAVAYKLCGMLVANSGSPSAAYDTRFIGSEGETLGKVNPQGSDEVPSDHKTKRNFIPPTDCVVTAVVRLKRPGTPQRKIPCTCRKWRRLRKSNSRQRRSVAKCQSRASAGTTDTQFVPR